MGSPSRFGQGPTGPTRLRLPLMKSKRVPRPTRPGVPQPGLLGSLCDTKTFTRFLPISDNRRFRLVEAFAVKTFWTFWGLLIATSALAEPPGTNVTAHLDGVSVHAVHSGVVFKC